MPGDLIVGTFSGSYGSPVPPGVGGSPTTDDADDAAAVADIGLVINEVASRGDPLDWFELHNSTAESLSLDGIVFADDLADVGKRTAFPAGTTIEAGGYLQVELDGDAWPGFALGGDEELGIWFDDGTLIDSVDWPDDAAADGSYARIPDATGDFATVVSPTPGGPNQP